MRAAAAELLDEGAPLPRFDDLTELTARLRVALRALVPQVEEVARERPEDDAERVRARSSARASVETARACLDAGPGSGLVSAKDHALSLAREVAGLCRHLEKLTGARTAEPA
ncbi:DUF6415 family natural product biosynthesis protein [Streptomyces sp. TS71-3]|uniref:DUF6415 family natural product biosynthesis protein n=1 Tax=Streptomyces sp. TS71-3 TaxID=2733862 RepID=UPI001B0F49B0|nr:DUF6415 family natural product biosynthesis protein [Streptomyces sp. TS71-3]GHJ39161.1 hypothetical protein Sm713_47700 [Streptomyces sp. TS71-3]